MEIEDLRVGQWLTRTNDNLLIDYYIKGKNYKIIGKVGDWIYIRDESGGKACFDTLKDWEPAPKTWETLEVGDIIKDKDGCRSKILEVGQNSFLRSSWDVFDEASGNYIFEEAKNKGWTIEQAETPDNFVQIKIDGNEIDITEEQVAQIKKIINI